MAFTRRELLQASAAVGLTATLAGIGTGAVLAAAPGEIPQRIAGKTGLKVSVLGLGGYHLGSVKDPKEATELVHRALDAGINFFDCAWEYHDGESEKRLGDALKGKRDRAVVMTKVCTHGRDKKTAMRMLEDSLRRLRTDHLDVWQVHEVVYDNDPELIFAKNGVAEALLQAKQEGKVRFVGFTGHKDPDIHLAMLEHGFPFDTVQMPLNAFDASFRSFTQHVLPVAAKQGLAIFGMKSMGGSGEPVVRGALSPQEALRYAMSLPVSTTISGMDALWVLEQNLEVARGFTPMSVAQLEALRDRVRAEAGDGRYELYKTTVKYDGAPGREQHHFPPTAKLPA